MMKDDQIKSKPENIKIVSTRDRVICDNVQKIKNTMQGYLTW